MRVGTHLLWYVICSPHPLVFPDGTHDGSTGEPNNNLTPPLLLQQPSAQAFLNSPSPPGNEDVLACVPGVGYTENEVNEARDGVSEDKQDGTSGGGKVVDATAISDGDVGPGDKVNIVGKRRKIVKGKRTDGNRKRTGGVIEDVDGGNNGGERRSGRKRGPPPTPGLPLTVTHSLPSADKGVARL